MTENEKTTKKITDAACAILDLLNEKEVEAPEAQIALGCALADVIDSTIKDRRELEIAIALLEEFQKQVVEMLQNGGWKWKNKRH